MSGNEEQRASAGWRVASHAGGGAAIAVIEIVARDRDAMDSALSAVDLHGLGVGGVRLADLLGVDRGVAARWSDTLVHLMPHAGPIVVMNLAERLRAIGIPEQREVDALVAYPEARDAIEARMLEAMARACSPLAVDLLLDQPRRWREREAGRGPSGEAPRVLDRLIDPPLVIATGPSNVGKSTLLNALAGRALAAVADEPGTTRDHVGVMLDLGGVVVRYVDTPGIRPDAPIVERQALATAMAMVAQADLVLSCGDGAQPAPMLAAASVLRVGLRADLKPIAWGADAKVCVPRGEGIESLVGLARDMLVPREALTDRRPWRFWRGGSDGAAAGPRR